MNSNDLSAPPAATAPHRPGPGGPAREFLAFKLGGQEYGIDILQVQEIRSYEAPLRVANAPAHLLGMLNLRGVIVPIVDLRIHLGFAEAPFDEFTITVLLQHRSRVFGAVVDAVSDVVALTSEQLRPLPEFGAVGTGSHLLAIGTLGDRTLALIDIDRLLQSPAMGLIDAASFH